MKSLAIFLALAPTLAYADDTFEARALAAQRVSRIDDVVWALTAPCDHGDDTEQRQCRKVRDTRVAELAGQALLVDADADAFDVGAWTPAKRSVVVRLAACVRCGGVELDGKTWFVAGPGAHFDGGKLRTTPLYDNARTFPDEAAAQAWAKQVAGAKVQLVVKLPAKPRGALDGKPAIAVDVLAYRVFTPCDGAIVVANPPSGPAAADKKLCVPRAAAKP